MNTLIQFGNLIAGFIIGVMFASYGIWAIHQVRLKYAIRQIKAQTTLMLLDLVEQLSLTEDQMDLLDELTAEATGVIQEPTQASQGAR